jgi:hypothetical protein
VDPGRQTQTLTGVVRLAVGSDLLDRDRRLDVIDPKAAGRDRDQAVVGSEVHVTAAAFHNGDQYAEQIGREPVGRIVID